MKDSWKPGEFAWFEYHCEESMTSGDAHLWLHSHQRVTILALSTDNGWAGATLTERAENAACNLYRVRFADGLEGDAFEDELLSARSSYTRPAPPPQ